MYWSQEYQEVPAFVLTTSISSEDEGRIYITKMGVAPQEFIDAPGFAVINPNHPYQEMIAFDSIDFAEWSSLATLVGVVRGVEGGPFAHPNGTELFIDQGEQYRELIENAAKEQLKRWLRTLL